MPSTLIIACLSQKGGVGKSTLTRLIARTYAAASWKVKIADFNIKQKTSVDWAALRMANDVDPEIAAEAFSSIKPALAQSYDLMVLDGRPDSDTSTWDCAKNAHLIVIPTGTSLDDLKPQVLFAHELAQRGIVKARMLFALNKTPESAIAIHDAKEYIQGAGYQVAGTDLRNMVGYQIAQDSGRAASETTFGTLNHRAELLAHEIADKATQLQGRLV